MPYQYEIHPAGHLVVVTAAGRIRGDEVVASVEAMSRDPRWVAGMHQLCDYRDIRGVSVSLPQMKHLASLERRDYEKIKDGKLAMVVRSTEVLILCELYAALIRFRGRTARVFRSMAEALDWIGLPADLEALLSGYAEPVP